jgi:hypothetical protein
VWEFRNGALLNNKTNLTIMVRFEVLTAMSTKMAVFWDAAPCSLVDNEERTISETSVNIYETTRRNIPEDNYFFNYHVPIFCLSF